MLQAFVETIGALAVLASFAIKVEAAWAARTTLAQRPSDNRRDRRVHCGSGRAGVQ